MTQGRFGGGEIRIRKKESRTRSGGGGDEVVFRGLKKRGKRFGVRGGGRGESHPLRAGGKEKCVELKRATKQTYKNEEY